MKLKLKSNLELYLLFVGSFILYYTLFNVLFITSSDLYAHNVFVEQLINNETLTFSHLGYHYLVVVVHTLTQFDLQTSANVLLSVFSATFVVWAVLISKSRNIWLWLLISLVVILGTAVYNPVLGTIYAGQYSSAIYHNPTYLLTRIISLYSIYYFFKVYKTNQKWLCFVLGIIMAAATWIKPNFAITFYGALFFVFMYFLLKKKLNECANIVLFTFPSVLMLLYLYIFTFGENSGGIVVLPFGFYRLYGHRMLNYPSSFIACAFFPLVSTFIILKNKMKLSIATKTSLLASLIGSAQFVLLAELNERYTHGNFAWSNASGFALAYLFCALEVKNYWNELSKKDKVVILISLALHVISGVVYIVQMYDNGVAWAL